MNPFTFSMAVHNVMIHDHDEEELASVELIYGNFDLWLSIFKFEFYTAEVRIVKPNKHLRIDETGRLNIADLIEKLESDEDAIEEELTLPHVGAGSIIVENWTIEITDDSLSVPFHTIIGPMTFESANLTTKKEKDSPYTFNGVTNTGETFQWSGTINASPIGSKGRIEFTDLSIPKHTPFVQHLFKGEIATGKISLATDYEIELSTDVIVTGANTTASMEDVTIMLPNSEEPLAYLQKASITVRETDLMSLRARVDSINVDGFNAHFIRRADGSINAFDMLVGLETNTSKGDGGMSYTGPMPDIQIEHIHISNGTARVTDNTNELPAELMLENITMGFGNLGTDFEQEITMEASVTVNKSGTASATARIRPIPLSLVFDTQGSGLGIDLIDPYIQEFTDFKLESGELAFDGRLTAKLTMDGEFSANWEGDQSISNISILDTATKTEAFTIGRANANGVNLSIWPIDLQIHEISVTDPSAKAIINEDRTINILNALGISMELTATTAETIPAEIIEEAPTPTAENSLTDSLMSDMTVEVKTVSIQNASAALDDLSTTPQFAGQLQKFSGAISGLSMNPESRATLEFSGILDNVAQLNISGTAHPVPDHLFSDIHVNISQLGLTEYTPYSSRFIGQKIKSGELEYGLNLRVDQRELNSDTALILNNFYLGDKVESNESLGLPVGLAVALLRDRNDQLKLPTLEIKGNLDDPSFNFSSVIMQAIGTMIGNIVTSPFKMFSGGGDDDMDISYIDFDSGSTQIDETKTIKLQALADMLYQRPALELDIIVPPTPEIDRPFLAENHLTELLKEEQLTKPTIAELPFDSLEQDQIDELIKDAYFHILHPGEERLAKKVYNTLFVNWRKDKDENGETKEEPKELTVAEMRTEIVGNIKIAPEEYSNLSMTRATTIRNRILSLAEIEPERIDIAPNPQIPEHSNASLKGARVFFGVH